MSLTQIIGGEDRLNLELLETSAWKTHEIIDRPASEDPIILKEIPRPFSEPEKARFVREDHYRRIVLQQAKEKQEAEDAQNGIESKYFIGPYDQAAPNGVRLALFKEVSGKAPQRLNFDGSTLNFHRIYREGSKAVVEVFPIAYSEWMACQNLEFTEAYKRFRGRIPNAGIGSSTVLVTQEKLFALTRRGVSTPNYPGTLFIHGGTLDIGDSVKAGFFKEINKEAKLISGEHYDPNDLWVTAIGEERFYYGTEHPRAEIVAYLPTSASWQDIAKARGKSFITDVSGIEWLASDPEGFKSSIVMKAARRELLPAAEFGLVMAYLRNLELQHGTEFAQKDFRNLMTMLNRPDRAPFFEAPQLSGIYSAR